MREAGGGALPPRIVVVSGSPGTGKTSVSTRLAEESPRDRAAHIHTDDFYQYIRKGYIAPWARGSGDQNETVVEAAAACARRFCAGGYEVVVDGTIGPWFIDPWIEIAREGVDVRYIVLRPDRATTVGRATARVQREFFPLDEGIVGDLWASLADLGEYEPHAVDTTGQTIDESVALIRSMLREGAFRIG